MTTPEGATGAVHRQIAQAIRNDIAAGVLRPGEKLPSSRELAAEWNVSVSAVNDAMDLLVDEKLVISKPRSGRVVATSVAERERTALRWARPRVIFVGGYAGSGKTELGRILTRETGWPILDKDTLTRSVVEAALVEIGSTFSDRESETYLNVIRPAEYEALMAAIRENIECGVSVIATAPFLREFADAAWVERVIEEFDSLNADVSFVWVRCTVETMHMYLRRRGAARDAWKLAHWDEYRANISETFRPAGPHSIIENNPTSESLQAQARTLLRTLQPERQAKVS